MRYALLAGLAVLVAANVGEAAPTEPLSLTHELTPWHNCSACHTFPNPPEFAGQPDIAPMAWQGSMMANAARDPVFWAGVALADQDASGETEDCIRCHSPRAFLEGRGDATAIEMLLPDDLGGVSCDLCHRMVDDGVTVAGNAAYVVDDAAVDGFVPRRGPWTYADGGMSPPHPWSGEGTHLASSRLCGTCHDVSTRRERVDEEGVGLGVPFGEQRTYSEWLGSAYAEPGDAFASCQDCHMPRVTNVPGCEMHALQGTVHDEGRRHDLVGANRHVTAVLREEYGAGGSGEIPDFHFDRSIERIDALLAESATLQVEVPARIDVGEGIQALVVTVTNETGHKLPTGYSEGRVMWLEVSATYAGQQLWGSGGWDADGLEADTQLRRYEAIAERYADGAQLHLVLNDHWVVDNRIPPRGLLPNPETDPVGDRYALRPEGVWPHWDTTAYAFDGLQVIDATPDDPDWLNLRVRLLYWVNTPEYVATLVDDNVSNGAGDHLAGLFDLHGSPEPMVLAEFVTDVALVGLSPAADTGTDTGTDTGPVGDSTSTGSGVADDTSGGGEPPGTTSGSVGDTGDGEPEAHNTADPGCGCRGPTTPARPPPSLLLLLLLLLARRRRARFS